MMPQSSQNLYFHLGMNADDDGFCEHFAIMRMTDSKPDDLKVLQAKGLVRIFDDKVLVVRDWKENNYIQSDRYTPSKYLEIYKEELKELASGIHNVYKADTQVRLGKVRIGKDTRGFDDTFTSFWDVYPKRIGKQEAIKAWRKLEVDEDKVAQIVSAVQEYKETEAWKKEGGRFIPYPATFLNQKRFEDEIPKGEGKKTFNFNGAHKN